MDAFAYFPAIVYRDEQPDLAKNVLATCVQALDQVRQPDKLMVQSIHLAAKPECQEVAKYLLSSAANILRSQGYSVDNYEFYLSGLWAQEIKKGASTNVHVHKNSQLCGWLFLETPEGGAYPVYHDTRTNKAMVELDFVQGDGISNATNMVHFNNMKPGSVLFSNSWMNHQLVGGMSDSPTRCIHFIISHKERVCNSH